LCETTVYDQVFKSHSACLTLQEEVWPQEHISEYLYRCMQYQLNPQEYTRKRIAFKVLSKADTSSTLSGILNDVNTWNDLHLFAGNINAPSIYVARFIDRTLLSLGKAHLYTLLVHPTDSINELEQRKHAVKLLMSDESYDQYSAFCKSLAQNETILLSFFGQDQFYQSSVRAYFDLPYFKGLNTYLNQSPLLLFARDLFSHHKRAFDFATSFAGACILPLYAASISFDLVTPDWLHSLADRLQGIAGKALGVLTLMPNKYVQAGTTLTAGAVCALSCKEDFRWAKANLDLDAFLHKKMVAMAKVMQTLKALADWVRDDNKLRLALPDSNYLVEFFDSLPTNSAAAKLINLLNTPTFQTDDTYLVHQGRVLVAFRLMHEVAQQPAFIKALYSVASLDAHLSIATLLRTCASQPTGFSFAEYSDACAPCIELVNFWHPSIDPSVVVCNSISLSGTDAGHNMLITGPNAAGKSTIMSGIIINLILAQTLGIVAAQAGTITPFSYIGTYINIVDDIAAGNSLFKAQVKRSFFLLSRIEKLAEHQRGFIAFDEPFLGTSDIEAAACIYSLCDALAKKKNIISAIATHYPGVQEIAHEYPAFGLYKVGVAIDSCGVLTYPFKLEAGFSNQYVALDILRQEGFSPQFLTNAQRKINTFNSDEYTI